MYRLKCRRYARYVLQKPWNTSCFSMSLVNGKLCTRIWEKPPGSKKKIKRCKAGIEKKSHLCHFSSTANVFNKCFVMLCCLNFA